MRDNLELVLLSSLSDAERTQTRTKVGGISILPDQERFSGTPLDLFDLEDTSPNRHVFLITENNDVVGIGTFFTGPIPISLWPPQRPAIQLLGFLIDHAMQGKGIGSRAASATLLLAPTVDPDSEVVQLTVNVKNPGARRAYEKAGFVTLDDLYLGGPAGPQHIMYAPVATDI